MKNNRYKKTASSRNTSLKENTPIESTLKKNTIPNVVFSKKRESAVIPLKTWDYSLWYPLGLVFLLMTIMSFWFGISADEVDMNNLGKYTLRYLLTFGADTTVLHLPVSIDKDQVLYLYGGIFDLIANLLNKISPFEEYTTRHILNAWVGFLGIYYASRICLMISGRRMAYICILIMFLSPYFLGQSMDNPKDVPFLAGYIASTFYLLKILSNFSENTWKSCMPLVVSIILSIDTRAAGIILIPYLFIFAFALFIAYKKDINFLKQAFMVSLLVGVIAYLGSSLLWPYAIQDPISRPFQALKELSHFKMNVKQMYEGKKMFSKDLPQSYLIKNFFITNTYILLIGFILGSILVIIKLKTSNLIILLFLIFSILFPVSYIILGHSNVYNAWRHVLFIFPASAILAAYFWDEFISWFKKPGLNWIPYSVLVVGLFLPLQFIIRTFPNFQCFYNEFVGGTKGAYGNYEMDSFWNSFKQSADWLKENEFKKLKPTDTIILAVNNLAIAKEYFKNDPRIKLKYIRFPERSMHLWDYAIFHMALVPDYRIRNQNWEVKGTIQASVIDGHPLCITIKRISKDDYLGITLLSQKNSKGKEYLENYLKLDPENELVNTNLFQYYFNRGKLDSAQSYLNQSNLVESESLNSQLNTGLMLLARGNPGVALESFSRLLNTPDVLNQPLIIGLIHYYKGQSLMALKQYPAALEDLQSSLQNPQLKNASLQTMIQIYNYLGNPQMVQKISAML